MKLHAQLKHQSVYYARYLGVLAIMVAIYIPYFALVIPEGTRLIVFSISSSMALGLLSFILNIIFSSTEMNTSLTFGGTRKGWLLSSFITQPIFSLLATLFITLAIPFAAILYKEEATLRWQNFLLIAALVLFFCTWGCAMGYIFCRMGMRWMIFSIIVSVAVSVMVLLLGLYFLFNRGNGFDIAYVLKVITGPIPIIILLAFSALLVGVEWQLIHKVEARGV